MKELSTVFAQEYTVHNYSSINTQIHRNSTKNITTWVCLSVLLHLYVLYTIIYYVIKPEEFLVAESQVRNIWEGTVSQKYKRYV